LSLISKGACSFTDFLFLPLILNYLKEDEKMKKIRLAVIGTGMAWERLHYPAIQKMNDKIEIVALANNTIEDAERFAGSINLDKSRVYDNYHEMLKRDDIDAVDILVPIESNFFVTRDVARAGKNIICEKPLAPDMEQARECLSLSSKYNVKIMIAENFRYNEENNKVRELIQNGKIGKVLYFVKNNVSNFPEDMISDSFAAKEWRQHPKFYGGAFLDAGVHDLATIRHIFGAVECLQAFGVPQIEEYCPYAAITTNILFKNGIIGNYNYSSSGVEKQYPIVGFRIFGTEGEIYLEEKSCGIINITLKNGSTEKISYTPEQGFYNELMNFYRALNGEEEISVTPDVEFGDTKMIFDIFESIRIKSVVYVDS
jgi:predicted dehydrogenase